MVAATGAGSGRRFRDLRTRFGTGFRGQGIPVTIAGRFQEALTEAEEPGLGGPELLPVRLAGPPPGCCGWTAPASA